MCEKSSTLAKACGIKHAMVLLGTSWGNTLGTCKTLWEHDGNIQKTKNGALLSVCVVEPSHWLHENYGHHFQPN